MIILHVFLFCFMINTPPYGNSPHYNSLPDLTYYPTVLNCYCFQNYRIEGVETKMLHTASSSAYLPSLSHSIPPPYLLTYYSSSLESLLLNCVICLLLLIPRKFIVELCCLLFLLCTARKVRGIPTYFPLGTLDYYY